MLQILGTLPDSHHKRTPPKRTHPDQCAVLVGGGGLKRGRARWGWGRGQRRQRGRVRLRSQERGEAGRGGGAGAGHDPKLQVWSMLLAQDFPSGIVWSSCGQEATVEEVRSRTTSLHVLTRPCTSLHVVPAPSLHADSAELTRRAPPPTRLNAVRQPASHLRSTNGGSRRAPLSCGLYRATIVRPLLNL